MKKPYRCTSEVPLILSEIVTKDNVFKDAKVIDDDGSEGVITHCDDLHNVFVTYDKGSGLYCLEPNCADDDTGKLLFSKQFKLVSEKQRVWIEVDVNDRLPEDDIAVFVLGESLQWRLPKNEFAKHNVTHWLEESQSEPLTDDWKTVLRRMKDDDAFDDKFDTSNLTFNYAFMMGFKAKSQPQPLTDEAIALKAIEALPEYAPEGFAHRHWIEGFKANTSQGLEVFNGAFSLPDVLQKLIDATKILLHKKDYDGGDYEEMGICVKIAEDYIQSQSPKFKIGETYQLEETMLKEIKP